MHHEQRHIKFPHLANLQDPAHPPEGQWLDPLVRPPAGVARPAEEGPTTPVAYSDEHEHTLRTASNDPD